MSAAAEAFFGTTSMRLPPFISSGISFSLNKPLLPLPPVPSVRGLCVTVCCRSAVCHGRLGSSIRAAEEARSAVGDSRPAPDGQPRLGVLGRPDVQRHCGLPGACRRKETKTKQRQRPSGSGHQKIDCSVVFRGGGGGNGPFKFALALKIFRLQMGSTSPHPDTVVAENSFSFLGFSRYPFWGLGLCRMDPNRFCIECLTPVTFFFGWGILNPPSRVPLFMTPV